MLSLNIVTRLRINPYLSLLNCSECSVVRPEVDLSSVGISFCLGKVSFYVKTVLPNAIWFMEFILVSGFVNGQVLTSLTATVNGFIKSQLLFDYEEVPDPLIKDDINVSTIKISCFALISPLLLYKMLLTLNWECSQSDTKLRYQLSTKWLDTAM